MPKKMMLIDPSRCTGCRGCQVSCKQWNELPAVKTIFTGSYQNPPDFDGETFNLVRFSERDNGQAFGVYWLMTSDRCRHCDQPTCVDGFSSREHYFIDANGAVVYTEKATGELDSVRDMCPFNIPRKNKQGLITKCTLCADRLVATYEENIQPMPACAKACPTGAIWWGDYEDMLKYAKERIAWLKANDKRVKADKVKLYPAENFPSHVKWILIDDRDAHGLVGDM